MNIRLFNNAGMRFPECYAYQKLLDTDKGRLRTTGDKLLVDCPKCLKRLGVEESELALIRKNHGKVL
jgi:hypothetical protein